MHSTHRILVPDIFLTSLEFTSYAVEVLKLGAQAKRVNLPSVNWSGRRSVALGANKMVFDGITYATNPQVNFAGIRFAQLESDSGTGATWTLYNAPCSWE